MVTETILNCPTAIGGIDGFAERGAGAELLDEEEGGVVDGLEHPFVGVDDIWVGREEEGVVVLTNEVHLEHNIDMNKDKKGEAAVANSRLMPVLCMVSPASFFPYSSPLIPVLCSPEERI